jgi:hypothetical protein
MPLKQFKPGADAFRHPCTLAEPNCRVRIIEKITNDPKVTVTLNSGRKVQVKPFPRYRVCDVDGNVFIIGKICLSLNPITYSPRGTYSIMVGWKP